MLEAGNAAATPAPATPAPVVTPEAEPRAAMMPAENKDAALDADLMAVWTRNNPERDDSGRFASKNETPAEEAVITDQPAVAEPEPAKPAIEAPNSWSAEMKGKFATLPPDVQTYVAQREGEAHKAISRAGEESKSYEPIRNAVESGRDLYQQLGMTPEQGINAMFQIERGLRENPAATIQNIARAYGVDLSRLVGGAPRPANGQQADPRVTALEGQLRQLTGHLHAQQQAAEHRRDAELAQTIAEFSKDKSDYWGPELELTVAGLIPTIREANPGKSPAEYLQMAYDQAVYANPVTRAKVQEATRKAEEAKKAEEARKAAEAAKKAGAINVRGTPASGKPKTMDQTIEETARRLYGNR